MHRDGFADIRRTEARSLRLETPRERRRRTTAAHLHLNAASGPLVHRGEIAGAFGGGPETPRRGHFGNRRDGRFRRRDREQRQGQIQEQGEKEYPGGGKAWPRR